MMPVVFGEAKETPQWGYPRQLRGHVGDVVDLSWSANGEFLCSCSLDTTSILWQISDKQKFSRI